MTLPSVTLLLISAPSSLHQSINQETNTDHPLLYLQIMCPRLYIKAVVTRTIPYLCLCFSSQWLETPHQAGYQFFSTPSSCKSTSNLSVQLANSM